MKLFSKVLCILSVLVLCVPFFCLSVSAEVSLSSSTLPSYYGIENFEPNEDGSGFKIAAEDFNTSGYPTYLIKNYLATKMSFDDLVEKGYGKYHDDTFCCYYPYYYSGNSNSCTLMNYGDRYFQFVWSLWMLYSSGGYKFNTEDNYYYFTWYIKKSTGSDYSYESGDIKLTSKEVEYCCTAISTTPFIFSKTDSGYLLKNAEKIIVDTTVLDKGFYDDEVYERFGTSYSCNPTNVYFDENMQFISMNYNFPYEDTSSYSEIGITECYTNCTNIDVSMFSNTDNLHFGSSGMKAETIEDTVSVTVDPGFTTDMIRTSDYFEFSITNNYNVPVQWVAYIIDESYDYSEYQYGEKADYSSGVYDYKVKDYMAHFEFELGGCKWLYLSDEYFYTFKSERDDFLWGVTQTYNYSLSKNHGSSYWHFLKKGETFSDRIYWENVGITADKEYSIRFRAIPVPETFECASLLFDKEWILNDPISYVEWHTNESNIADTYKLDYEWYTFDVEFILSDTLKNMYLDSDNVKFIYNSKFSIDDVPAYSSVTPNDSKSNTSSGFLNDKNTVFDANYKLNVETGEEEFIDLSVSNNNSFDVGDVSAEDVSEYLDFSEGFFSLLGTVFSYLPPFIWALIAFGLTAFIVIAIAKWIIT